MSQPDLTALAKSWQKLSASAESMARITHGTSQEIFYLHLAETSITTAAWFLAEDQANKEWEATWQESFIQDNPMSASTQPEPDIA